MSTLWPPSWWRPNSRKIHVPWWLAGDEHRTEWVASYIAQAAGMNHDGIVQRNEPAHPCTRVDLYSLHPSLPHALETRVGHSTND